MKKFISILVLFLLCGICATSCGPTKLTTTKTTVSDIHDSTVVVFTTQNKVKSVVNQ